MGSNEDFEYRVVQHKISFEDCKFKVDAKLEIFIRRVLKFRDDYQCNFDNFDLNHGQYFQTSRHFDDAQERFDELSQELNGIEGDLLNPGILAGRDKIEQMLIENVFIYAKRAIADVKEGHNKFYQDLLERVEDLKPERYDEYLVEQKKHIRPSFALQSRIHHHHHGPRYMRLGGQVHGGIPGLSSYLSYPQERG
jgi:hypothetical protein